MTPHCFQDGVYSFSTGNRTFEAIRRTHFPVWGKTCRQLPVRGLANRGTLLTVPPPACHDLMDWFRWTDHNSLPHLKASTWKKKKWNSEGLKQHILGIKWPTCFFRHWNKSKCRLMSKNSIWWLDDSLRGVKDANFLLTASISKWKDTQWLAGICTIPHASPDL